MTQNPSKSHRRVSPRRPTRSLRSLNAPKPGARRRVKPRSRSQARSIPPRALKTQKGCKARCARRLRWVTASFSVVGPLVATAPDGLGLTWWGPSLSGGRHPCLSRLLSPGCFFFHYISTNKEGRKAGTSPWWVNGVGSGGGHAPPPGGHPGPGRRILPRWTRRATRPPPGAAVRVYLVVLAIVALR